MTKFFAEVKMIITSDYLTKEQIEQEIYDVFNAALFPKSDTIFSSPNTMWTEINVERSTLPDLGK